MRAIYSSVVKILMLQAKVILMSAEDLFKHCEGDLAKFIAMDPRLSQQQNCFCGDAFEIGWIQEKAVFLIEKSKEVTKDWLSVDYQRKGVAVIKSELRDTDSMELDS
jgi:hypothetical protein